MPTPSTRTGAPNWVDLLTTDAAGAERFYGDLFGWVAEHGDQEKYGGYLTFFKDGKAVAGAMQKDDTMPMPDLWNVYLSSTDAAGTLKSAEEHGGTVFMGPMEVPDVGVMGMVGDAGGVGVGVYQGGQFPGLGVIAEPGAPGWFELHSKNFAAATEFYRDVFGWELVAVSDTDEFRYSTLGPADSAAAGVMDASQFPDDWAQGWFVYFAVEGTDASVARALELGGSVLHPAEDTPYGRLATLRDPFGAIFKLIGPNNG